MQRVRTYTFWSFAALGVLIGAALIKIGDSSPIFSRFADHMARVEYKSAQQRPVRFLDAGTGASSEKTVAFFGDMMLDRYVRLRIEESGPDYPFVHLPEILAQASRRPSHVVVNGEGAFSGDESVTRGLAGSPLRFTFDPSWLPALRRAGIDFVSQSNNHMLDFGWPGYRASMNNIETAGLAPFGSPDNEGPAAHIRIGNATATLMAFNQFSPTLSPEAGVAKVSKAIKAASDQGEFVIVFPHWGEEYERYPTEFQRTAAAQFIDAGADLIVGAHPHVVQISERIAGVPVYYSLGNFIFDQAFMPEVREGMMLSVTLASDNKKNISVTDIEEIMFDIREGRALPRVVTQ